MFYKSYIYLSILLFITINIDCDLKKTTILYSEISTNDVTMWTEKFELFMEYPTLVENNEARFAIHLTKLTDFRPLPSGNVTLTFTNTDNEESFTADPPKISGIFGATVNIAFNGEYDLNLYISSDELKDTIKIGEVIVYKDLNSIQAELEEKEEADVISFLKEQQWNTEFATSKVKEMTLTASVKTNSIVKPKIKYYAEVSSLVSGIILLKENNKMASIGEKVKKGEVLLTISPPLKSDNGFTNLVAEYEEAKSQFKYAESNLDRMRKLHKNDIVSLKKLQNAELDFNIADAKLRSFNRSLEAQSLDLNNHNFFLKAPISGIISSFHFTPGEYIEVGQKLFSIVNTSIVWLESFIPVSEINRVKGFYGIYLNVDGIKEEIFISKEKGKLISIGQILDPSSNTVPVIFEINNPENILKIGMLTNIRIRTHEEINTLTIPSSAIFEDEGKAVCYIQTDGESFIKKEIQTGIEDKNHVQILKGLSGNERIVTKGGYQVKLASMSSIVPTGHAH